MNQIWLVIELGLDIMPWLNLALESGLGLDRCWTRNKSIIHRLASIYELLL